MATDTERQTRVRVEPKAIFGPEAIARYEPIVAAVGEKLINWHRRFSLTPDDPAYYVEAPEYIFDAYSNADLAGAAAWLGFLDGAVLAGGESAIAMCGLRTEVADVELIVAYMVQELSDRHLNG